MKHTLSLQILVVIGSLLIGCDRHRQADIRRPSKPANASAWSAEDVAASPMEFLTCTEKQVTAAIATGEQKIQSLERQQADFSDKLKTLRNSSASGEANPLLEDYALALDGAATECQHARDSLKELKSRRDQLVIGRERVGLKVHEQDIYKAVELATSALILADREFPPGSITAPAAPVAAPTAVVQTPTGTNPRPANPYRPIPYPSNPPTAPDPVLAQAIVAVDVAIREKRFDDALEQCRRAGAMRGGSAHSAAARGRALDAIYDEANRLERRGGNAAEVIPLYRKAADNGHVRAQLELGNIYREGRIVQQNPNEALKWYRLSSELGYDKAQANLGMLLYQRGTPQDKAEGVKWLQQAARNGNAGAQNTLNQLRVKW